jgi:hypothetical protein
VGEVVEEEVEEVVLPMVDCAVATTTCGSGGRGACGQGCGQRGRGRTG